VAAEKALGRRPVRVGSEGKECFVYRGDVANRAIQVAGIEAGMFTEKREVKHLSQYDRMSDAELLEVLAEEATFNEDSVKPVNNTAVCVL